MASCSFSSLLHVKEKSVTCGISSDYPGYGECVTIRDCSRDVSSHLRLYKISADQDIDSEIKLLLARAGKIFLFYIKTMIC